MGHQALCAAELRREPLILGRYSTDIVTERPRGQRDLRANRAESLEHPRDESAIDGTRDGVMSGAVAGGPSS